MLRARSSSRTFGALVLWAGVVSAPVAGAQGIALIPSAAGNATLAPPTDARLAALGYRLALANSGLCARPRVLTGLMFHDRSSYDEGERDSVAQRYGLGEGF